MKIALIILFVFSESILFADGLREGFEVDNQDVFNGVSNLSWIGDVNDFKITSATWPYGSTPDFTGAHSLRSQNGSALNSTILTNISEVYNSSLKMRWEIFVSGSSANITSSKGFALILFVDSSEADSVELGRTKGYRIRLADPSGTAYPDGLYFEKANGINWTIIDSVHTGSANINMGWRIVVEQDVSGQWVWGFRNGLNADSVSLNDTIFDNEFSDAKYSGINWYSIASEAGDFGCDEFVLDPYTPGLWKNDAISNNWMSAVNWDNEEVPDVNTDIVIAKGIHQPELSEDVECNNLTLEAGSGIILQNGSSMHILGDLKLKSDNTGNASIVDFGSLSVEGNKIVECYLQNSSGDSTEYHFFSSPINPQNIENYFQKFYVYSYDETQASWYGLNTGDQFEVGKGYSVYNSMNSDTIIYFTGDFNTGDAIVHLSNSNDRWNLIGNPFPSTIDWDLIDKSSIESSIYMWNPTTLSYSYYNNGVGVNFNNDGLVGSMQAFFVRAINSGQFTIPQNSRCISNNQSLLKNINNSIQLIRLSLVSGAFKDELVIRFKEDASNEFDVGYDALKLLSEYEVPQIYSISSEKEMMSINTLPKIIDSCELELEIRAQEGGQYHLQLEEALGFQQYELFIEDIDFGSQNIINLKDTNRLDVKIRNHKNLKLKIKKKKAFEGEENLIEYIYQKGSYLILGFKNRLPDNSKLEIYSMEGRKQGEVLCRKGQQELRMSVPKIAGTYIINIKLKGVNHSKKINIIL